MIVTVAVEADIDRQRSAGQGAQRDGKHLIPLGLCVVGDRHRECLGLARRPGEHQHRGGRGVVAPGGRRPAPPRSRP